MKFELLEAARAVRPRAYAPYSHFLVGAALLSRSGKIYTGCNVENISYGLTLCAERSAVAAAVADGEREFAAIAIVADTEKPISPCGACRQVLAEFSPNLEVFLATLSGKLESYRLIELLPRPQTGILHTP